MQTKTTVINIIGGPGVGKSTIATGVFSNLKRHKISCELVSEYAKEITWEETQKLLENQIHIFAEQFRRQWRLIDKVDYIISDSPLILNSIYYDYYLTKLGDKVKFSKYYIDLSRQFFDSTFLEFNNINYLVNRDTSTFEVAGRNQDLTEALDIDLKIKQTLFNVDPTYREHDGDTNKVIDAITKQTLKDRAEI